jgi:hypothetical protein
MPFSDSSRVCRSASTAGALFRSGPTARPFVSSEFIFQCFSMALPFHRPTASLASHRKPHPRPSSSTTAIYYCIHRLLAANDSNSSSVRIHLGGQGRTRPPLNPSTSLPVPLPFRALFPSLRSSASALP